MDDPVYSTWLADNLEFDTDHFRFGYTSLVVPTSAYDETFATGDASARQADARCSAASTRTTTPRRGCGRPRPTGRRCRSRSCTVATSPLDGTAPALLYGYGSYESSVDPTFSSIRVSLLDRGFVFAIAHIRGGGELGRQWYEQGRLQREAQHVHRLHRVRRAPRARAGYTAPDRLGGTRRQRRRAADGRGREPPPRPLPGGRRRGAVRRRGDHDAGRRPPAHRDRVGGVGKPARRSRTTTRTCSPTRPTTTSRRRTYPALLVTAGLNDPAGVVLGAGEVGGQAAGDQDRRPHAAPQDRDGRRPRRPVRPVRRLARRGAGPRVPHHRTHRSNLMTDLDSDRRPRGRRRPWSPAAAAASGSAVRSGSRATAPTSRSAVGPRTASPRRSAAPRQARPTARRCSTSSPTSPTRSDVAAAVAAAAERHRDARRRRRVRRRLGDARPDHADGHRGLAPDHRPQHHRHHAHDQARRARSWRAPGAGSIVGISSIASSNVHPWFGAYGPGKAGIDHVCQLAADRARARAACGSTRSVPAWSTPTWSSFVTAGGAVLDDYLECMPIARRRDRRGHRGAWRASSSARSPRGSPASRSTSTVATA